MKTENQCLNSGLLERYQLGQVGPAERLAVETHLMTCPACAETLHSLAASDTFVEGLRQAQSVTPTAVSPTLDDLIARVKALALATPTPEAADTRTQPPAADLADDFDFLAPPERPDELGRLAHYRVLAKRGEGGMGVVFLAEDLDLERPVALKVMRPKAAAVDEAGARFQREAKTMAALKHDHVATVYQVGHDRGVPFLAMEFLLGQSLEDRLRDDAPIPTSEILRIGRETALGLAAAHARGVIHRDVKPSNIWLEAPGGRVKLLDFGLARPVETDQHLTHSGANVGTPADMAPEQARGKSVDGRADLFSLGCVLYRMCSGAAPFQGATLLATLSALAECRPTSIQEINSALPLPLAQLIDRLLAKGPADRPASAIAVAEELQRIDRDLSRPAAAAPPTPLPRRGEGRRNRPTAWAGVAAGLAVVLIAGAAWMSELIFRTPNGTLIVRINDPAVEARFKNGALNIYAANGSMRYTLKPSENNKSLPPGNYKIELKGVDGLAVDVEEFSLVSNGEKTVYVRLAAPDNAGRIAGQTSKLVDAKQSAKPAATRPIAADPLPTIREGEPLSPFALVRQPAKIPGVRRWTIETVGHRGYILSAFFSPDNQWLATFAIDGTFRVWNVATGRLRHCFYHRPDQGWMPVAWSPDGRLLAGVNNWGFNLWDLTTGRTLRSVEFPAFSQHCYIGFSRQGNLLGVSWNGRLRLYDMATGDLSDTLEDTHGFSFGPNETLAATSLDCRQVRIWDLKKSTLARTLSVPHGELLGEFAHFNPSGTLLLTSGEGGKRNPVIRVWEVATGNLLSTITAKDHKLGPHDAAHRYYFGNWMADGETVFALATTVDRPGSVTIVEARTGKLLRSVTEPDGRFLGHFSHNAEILATNPLFNSIALHATPTGAALRTIHGRSVMIQNNLQWMATGRLRLLLIGTSTTRVDWDVASGDIHRVPCQHGTNAYSPDGKRIACDYPPRIVDDQFRLLHRLQHDALGWGFAWSADGKTLATSAYNDGAKEKATKIWEAATGRLIASFADVYSSCLALSANGSRLAAASPTELSIIDIPSAKTLRTIPVPPMSGLTGVAWSPNDETLAVARPTHVDLYSGDGQKHLRDFVTFPTGRVCGVAWSPDGCMLATCISPATLVNGIAETYAGSTIFIWHAGTGAPLTALVAIDEDKLLTLSADGHYRGSPARIDRDIVYVVETDAGQETLTPDEFAAKYNWRNDPSKVRLADGSRDANTTPTFKAPIAGGSSHREPTPPVAPKPTVKYTDETYDFSLTPPAGWKPIDPAKIRVEGELRRAWTPGVPINICVFVQPRNRPATDARKLVEREARLLKATLGVEIIKQEVRELAGMKAASILYTGKGTGGSVDGKSAVRTAKRRVAIPRGNLVIVLDVVTPADGMDEQLAVFEKMLASLELGGTQTPEQRAAK